MSAPGRVLRRVAAPLALVVAGSGACAGGEAGGRDQLGFCEQLEQLATDDPFAGFGDVATAAEIEEGFGALRARAGDLAAVAPDDARALATAYAEAVDELDSLLAGGGYVPSQVDARRYGDAQRRYDDLAARLEQHLTTCSDDADG